MLSNKYYSDLASRSFSSIQALANCHQLSVHSYNVTPTVPGTLVCLISFAFHPPYPSTCSRQRRWCPLVLLIISDLSAKSSITDWRWLKVEVLSFLSQINVNVKMGSLCCALIVSIRLSSLNYYKTLDFLSIYIFIYSKLFTGQTYTMNKLCFRIYFVTVLLLFKTRFLFRFSRRNNPYKFMQVYSCYKHIKCTLSPFVQIKIVYSEILK